jgi:hypothetical protein
MLGHAGKLKYLDHIDVEDESKFPKLVKRVFLQTTIKNPFIEPIGQPYQWETELEKMGILGLLDLPHFWRGQNETICVKKLLEFTHGGDIWMDKPFPITIDLIVQITRLRIRGMDPTLFLDEKTKEKALVEEIKKKNGTARGTRGIIIKQINNAAMKLGMEILSCKLLRKFHKEEVPTRVVAVAD